MLPLTLPPLYIEYVVPAVNFGDVYNTYEYFLFGHIDNIILLFPSTIPNAVFAS
ncbi:hypothetical protein [uncultured Eubacterium sp.]|uniref:hypothetical protein n=1 Tax=uncultured Eubacterium sp. TaxID=165185 RepID=UPI00280542C8|nr:hypothetical protein [uncultured Eubacterium sp.]